jgi:hypothetical protein
MPAISSYDFFGTAKGEVTSLKANIWTTSKHEPLSLMHDLEKKSAFYTPWQERPPYSCLALAIISDDRYYPQQVG